MARERRALRLAGVMAMVLCMIAGCAGLRSEPGKRRMAFSFAATMVRTTTVQDSGVPTAFRLTLDPAAKDKGMIRERRWNQGKDPRRERPDYDETTALYELRSTKDGARVTCKADVPLKKPTVTFEIAGGEAPTVTERIEGSVFGVRDGMTLYVISERDRRALLEFIRRAGFPEAEGGGREGA